MKRFLCIALVVGLAAACGPKCLRGHDEMVHVPEWIGTDFIHVGDIMVPVATYHPAYDEPRFVCDVYQERQR